jgi:beta-ribofuranosylaminobenzene 5'-phosphate synthase
MTLIDLNGSYARSNGGIGLTLSDPCISLKGELSEKGVSLDFTSKIEDEIKEDVQSKILSSANRLINHFSIENGFHFTLEKAYQTHSGLGSGTQIALSTGRLIYELLKDDFGIEYSNLNNNLINRSYNNSNVINSVSMGEILKRGGTSGIGIFSFDHGGFILDGGHNLNQTKTFLPSSASSAKPPVLLGNYDFPKDWDLVVAIANGNNMVTGEKEINIFQKYCPVPKNDVEKLSHLIMMNLIPFMLEKDIESFGKIINQIQDLGFKKVEIDLQSNYIKTVMEKMREFGAYGVGMSSFGPAIYGITHKNTKKVYKATKEYLGDNGTVFVTKAQNHGHILEK